LFVIHISIHFIVLETYNLKMFVSPLHYPDPFMKDIICLDPHMIYIIAMKHVCDSKNISSFWLQMVPIKSYV
jgi:hypothetical protein